MPSLKNHHSFAIEAQAKTILEITALEQFQQVWAACKQRNEPVLFLGQGSNVLFVRDFVGTVLLNRLKGIEHKQDQDFHYLHIAGGENWHELVQWTLRQNIGGLENLALIPGCVGSAPIQNIGAYGVEFKDVCDYVDVLDLTKSEVFRLTQDECQFAYRDSVFKHKYAKDFVIVAVGLRLTKQWQPMLQYGHLASLDKRAVTPQQVFDQVCATRRSKLPDPAQLGNAGSFFKNPVVTNQQLEVLKAEYNDVPYYPLEDGFIKLAAGWLIDQCGLKGYQIGGAAVHQKQALVIVNKDNATSSDVIELAHHIRQAVAAKFDVYLVPEVRFIGEAMEVNAEDMIS